MDISSPIIIPPEHIYQSDNQKVIDNQIDKIEVQTYAPQIINATENVYNETVSGTFPPTERQVKYNTDIHYFTNWDYAIAWVSITPTYVTKTFIIPKNIDNTSILRILTGKDDNNSTNIKYTVRGDINKGTANAVGTVSFRSHIGNVLNAAITNVEIVNSAIKKQQDSPIKENTSYLFTDDDKKISASAKNDPTSATGAVSTSVTLELSSIDNIATAKATETQDGKNYEITLTILIGLDKIALKADAANADFGSGTFTKNIVFDGVYEEYIPKQVEVSFNGDIIKLDLQENTITIGDGNNLISFTGNELMQTTNKPSAQYNYTNIIEQYKNGKELATIRVGIENFYDINNKKEIEINILNSYIVGAEYTITISSKTILKNGYKLHLDNGTILTVTSFKGNDVYYTKADISSTFKFGTQKAVVEALRISITRENNLPMTIHNGDIVIPYVYGANNKNKPMSLYKDGSPKLFMVVSEGLPFDGAIFKTLTLQEVSKIRKFAYIKLVASYQQNIEQTQIEAIFIYGSKFEGGDTIVYENAEGYVNTSIRDNNEFYFLCDKNSSFDNNIGEIILVTIKEK